MRIYVLGLEYMKTSSVSLCKDLLLLFARQVVVCVEQTSSVL